MPAAEELEPGFTLADFIEPDVDVWPEHHRAFEVFSSLSTQWRAAMGGFYGLDYAVLYHKLDRMGLAPDEYEQIERDISVMEQQALLTMQEGKKK